MYLNTRTQLAAQEPVRNAEEKKYSCRDILIVVYIKIRFRFRGNVSRKTLLVSF